MKKFKNKKIRLSRWAVFCVVFIVLAGALWGYVGNRVNAADTIGISIDSTSNPIVKDYTMVSKEIVAYFHDNNMFDDPKYIVTWSVLTGTDVIDIQAGINGTKSCKVEAKKTGTAQLVVLLTDSTQGAGAPAFQQYSCNITVKFGIDTVSNSSDFAVVNKDTERSLVMTCGEAAKKVDLIFSSAGATWTTTNKDVVSVSNQSAADTGVKSITSTMTGGSIYIHPEHAGTTTIRVDYTEGTTMRSTSIRVYVRPRIRKDDPTIVWETANINWAIDTNTQIYADVDFTDDSTVSLDQKVAWVMLYAPDNNTYKFLKDSLGNTGSFPADTISMAGLKIHNSNAGAYQIYGRAGKYQLLFFPSGAYTEKYNDAAGFYDACMPVVAQVTIYAKMRSTVESMIVGDVMDLANYFNLTPDFVTNNLDVTSDPMDLVKIVKDKSVTLTAEQTGLVDVTVAGRNNSLDPFLKPGESAQNIITIRITGGLSLNITKANTYVGSVINLQALYAPYEGATYDWKINDPKYATVTATNEFAVVVPKTKTEDGKPAIITVVCTLTSGVQRMAKCELTIRDSITSIKITPSELTMLENKVEVLKTDSKGSAPFKWLTSDPTVATVVALDGQTAATVSSGKAGTAIITVMNEQNYITATCKVTVVGEVTDLKFSQGTKMTVKMSQGVVQMLPVMTPANPSGVKLEWGSSKTDVATVDDNGLVTLVGPGTTTIQAKVKNNYFIGAYCDLTVLQTSTGLKFKSTAVAVESGKTQQLEYTLTPANADTKVSFTSMDPQIASVTATGVVSGITGGQTYIVATTSEGFTDICKVTVTQLASGITLSTYDVTVMVGKTFQVTAKTTPASSTETTFSWASKDTAIATVDNKGVITGVSAGSTMVTVKTKSAKLEIVYVTVKEEMTGMTLNYNTRTIAKGKTFTLKPVFNPATVTNKKVTWKSSNTSKATVSSSGVVKGVNGGAAVITCISEDGGYMAFCVVNVEEVATSITLSPSSTKLGLGKKLTIKATIKSNFSTNQKLKWSTSNSKVATVNQNGQITGKKLGKCVITARSTDGSGRSGSCSVTVVRQVTGLKLNKTTIRMLEGRTTTIRATVTPSNATAKKVTWSSSDENIATIDTSGMIMAIQEGRCKITATSTDGSKKKATCWVYVSTAVPATGVTVSQKDMIMVRGTSAQISVTIQPSGSTDGIQYASDNSNVASITSKGRVTARKPGVASIIVTTSSGRQTMVNVTVVGLNKTTLVMRQYETENLWVEAVSTNVTWQSQDTSIATVDQSGRVVCRKPGTTSIVASVNGIKLYCKVTVLKLS